jgi:hypothetical protein
MPNKDKEHIGELIGTALSRAQPNIKTAAKSGINPHFGSKYSDLKDVIDACRDALNNEGIVIHFESGFTPERTEAKLNEEGKAIGKTHFPRQDFLSLKLILGEQVLVSTSALVCARDDMQSRAGAQTYAMRQLLVAALCIASTELVDDDGNSAVGEEKMAAKVNKRSNYRKTKPVTPEVQATAADDFLK